MKSREERSKQFFDVDLNDGYVPDEIDEYYERVLTKGLRYDTRNL